MIPNVGNSENPSREFTNSENPSRKSQNNVVKFINNGFGHFLS